MRLSVVIIVPAALREPANAFCNAQGWPGDNFQVALHDRGDASEASHYGMRASASEDVIAIIQAAIDGNALLSAAVTDVLLDEQRVDHFDEVISRLGLLRVGENNEGGLL